MSWGGVLAVGGGAAVGAWLRWGLGIVLNPVVPTLPLGTLAANLAGGVMMGGALERAARHAALSPDVPLLPPAGGLAGLTAFPPRVAQITTPLLRRDLLR